MRRWEWLDELSLLDGRNDACLMMEMSLKWKQMESEEMYSSCMHLNERKEIHILTSVVLACAMRDLNTEPVNSLLIV